MFKYVFIYPSIDRNRGNLFKILFKNVNKSLMKKTTKNVKFSTN